MTNAREMFDRLLPMFLDKDLAGFADLFAEDGVHELPFAPPGVPGRIQGRENIRAYLTAIIETPLMHKEFQSVTVYETQNPEVAIAEFDAHGVVTTSGRPYVMRYLQILQVSGGQIALWRDYWNPAEGARLLGTEPQ
ncbi:nuclear transport factor 2 family protein [Saccharomonospora sp. NPDC046836]|uniref:nuclear transport factor 2 family protein n=1 Tax=Saccharomonospora sp. NPDC046836 TaxID=3156921 RepID=UPI0033C21681